MNNVPKLNQWSSSQLMPIMEYKLRSGDWLEVVVGCAEEGLYFDFDDLGLKTWFSGEVKKRGAWFFIEFDECLSLDEELQRIDEEITEGFLLPNNLYCCEE